MEQLCRFLQGRAMGSRQQVVSFTNHVPGQPDEIFQLPDFEQYIQATVTVTARGGGGGGCGDLEAPVVRSFRVFFRTVHQDGLPGLRLGTDNEHAADLDQWIRVDLPRWVRARLLEAR